MKKCQTAKNISLEDNRNKRKANITHENHLTLFSNKKLPISNHQQNLHNKIILTKKHKRKNITNILINDNNTISNISLNSNSNNIFNDSNNSYKYKIYQKKRIPVPKKENDTKGKDNYISISIKKRNINFKKNLNVSNGIENEKYYSIKDVKSEEKNKKLNTSNKNSISPKIYNKNNNKKYISIKYNNINNRKRIKKYLYLNNNLNSININEKNKAMSDRHAEKPKKTLNSNNYKKLDLLKINKIKNINNININLNNINNLNNKIDSNEILKNINSGRNKNAKFKDINFLKKLNFDQPRKNNISGYNNIANNNSSNKILFNNHIEISDRNKSKKNYVYQNSYTLNESNNINTEGSSNILKKKILYKIKPKIITPIILTPRNRSGKMKLKGENKIIYSNDINSTDNKLKNKNNLKNDLDINGKKCYRIPFQININETNNKKIDLFEDSKQKNSNINKVENINRINIFLNNGNNNIFHGNKKINININNNFDKNIMTSESLTIFNSSNSDIPSYTNSSNISQIESEKGEKKNVLSSYKLNLYLNEAKKSNPKNININNINNNRINKALLYITNSNKYHTEINNNNENKTVVIINKDKENKAYKRNYIDKYIIYNYNTRTYNSFKQKLRFNNFLFISINTEFKLLLLKFLDKKSLVILSSLNKTFYKNLRKKIYKYFFEKIIKNNGNKTYILKVFNTITNCASKDLKINNAKNLQLKYEFYKNSKSLYDNIILQDITRTFPNDPSFKVDSINYKKLYNLLKSYSNYNTNIGYAQGLNFLAATSIFLFKNEEKIFIFLDGLINRFKLNNLLSINNQELPKNLDYFSKILNKYCYEFINYLSSKLLNHEFFSTGWLLTLFSNSMDRNKLFICWCFMAIFGWKFFFSFVIQLLLFYKNTLLKINETKLSSRMKEILKGKQFVKDFNKIIKKTFLFMSNNIVL